ncbi:hypothetical protein TNIN_275701 [Trichonephila inaurata madagascariensis]|uniref:Transmembrane protein n=1 Tax=Trichonephila inaurata madagascariensis TaxID=2747483 RepID=A0A8X6WV95_9ARAC|nr:hypothetical protein TNIN_275701 [Trichonephila inaurata madagascariensis]
MYVLWLEFSWVVISTPLAFAMAAYGLNNGGRWKIKMGSYDSDLGLRRVWLVDIVRGSKYIRLDLRTRKDQYHFGTTSTICKLRLY